MIVIGGPGCTGPLGTPKPGVTVASGGLDGIGGDTGAVDAVAAPGGAIRGAGMRGDVPAEGEAPPGASPLPDGGDGAKLGGGVFGGGIAGAARCGGGERIATRPGI